MSKRINKIAVKIVQLSFSTQKRIHNIISKIVNVVSVKNTFSNITKKAYSNILNALIKIPIIISQSYYKTLTLVVSAGNFVNSRWLILNKSLSITSSVFRTISKNIFKNMSKTISSYPKKTIVFVKEFFTSLQTNLSKQNTFIKVLSTVINSFSKFFSPVRYLVISTYVKIMQNVDELKRKRIYTNVTLIRTKLTPLTRQVKTWVSRRFVKSTLK